MNEITVKTIAIKTEPAGNPPDGYVYEWITVVDGAVVINTKQSDGTVGTVAGAQGDSLPDQTGHTGEFLYTDGTTAGWTAVSGSEAYQTIAAKTADYQIVEADNNKLFTNEGATADVELTLPERSTLPAGWKIKAVNEAGSSGIDSYTKLMLHMNGDNNGTTFTDSSASAHTISDHGNAVTKTGTKKFGTASGYFDGTGDYLSIPNSSDFDLGSSWAMDFWVYPETTGEDKIISTRGTNGWEVLLFNKRIGIEGFGSNLTSGPKIGTTDLTLNTWNHVAITFNGTNLYSYINGVLDLTYANSFSWSSGSNTMYVGSSQYAEDFTGYIDELRISKGIARWTSNFTPPSAEYYTAPLILTPYSGDQLPTTAAADNQLISSAKGDVVEFENTGTNWIANIMRPEANWVDGL